MFTIPCVIGNASIEHTMLDLGASINVMSQSLYTYLKLGHLEETRVIIQLADWSDAYLKVVIKGVLCK